MQGLSFLGSYSYGQNPINGNDTIQIQDSSFVASDSISKTDTISTAAKGDIETTIQYSAKDSIIMDVINKKVYLYGNAKIDYGDISLTAGEIIIDWETNLMTAQPGIDSAGKKIGIPLFKDKLETYEVQNFVKYNFKTKKGLSSGVVTKQGEGYIHGEKIKKVEENLYVSRAQYTTCDLSHPHFFINATKLKVIPEDKIISGPFNLVVADVPTPLGFFLGFFPIPKKEKSGLIIPTGGSSTRGFFLRNGGYYWAVNDYLGLQAVGDAYANGSYRANLSGNYTKRYAYSGSASFSYSKFKSGFDSELTDPFVTDLNVMWTHRTQTKRNSSLSANVNAGSSSYFKHNSYNPTAIQTGVFRSSINYYKKFGNSPFSLNLALSQSQNVTTKVMDFTFPDATFAMNRIYPFKRKNAIGPAKLYENINISYTGNAKVFITNDSNRTGGDKTLPFNGNNLPILLKNAQYGMRHDIPISTTFKPTKTFLRYFNITPNVNYTEFWYTYRLNNTWVNTLKKAIPDTINEFSRAYSYNGSLNLSTTVYGMYRFQSKKLLAVRHTIIPTVGYSYKPDFTAGNYDYIKSDTFGNFQYFSKHAGSIIGEPSRGKSSSLTFNIMNSLEGKIASKSDTITGTKKIKLIDQLSISGNYNFAAEKNKLSSINASARTRLFDRFDINTNAVFDPYIYRDSTGSINKKTYTYYSNDLAIKNGQGLAKLTNYNISIGANLNPNAKKVLKSNKGTESELRQINMDPYNYVNFNIPWTLMVNYNINYSKRGNVTATTTQSFTFNGDIRLTEKWKIGFNSGYDVVRKTLTTTRLDIYRDLHCWQMSFNVVPFGPQRSYAFTINAKSSILQDLKLNKKSPAFYGNYY